MTPARSFGSHRAPEPCSVANTTSCPWSRRWCHGTATSVVSKSRSGSGMRTFISRRVARGGAGLCLRGLDLAVLRLRVRHPFGQQVLRHVRDLLDRTVERLLVRRRRWWEAAERRFVLERRLVHFLVGRGRVEVVER